MNQRPALRWMRQVPAGVFSMDCRSTTGVAYHMAVRGDLPPTLYRYYPESLRTLENIKSECIYFGSVADFNDPFECQVMLPKVEGGMMKKRSPSCAGTSA